MRAILALGALLPGCVAVVPAGLGGVVRIGNALASAGDVDGDGTGDLVVLVSSNDGSRASDVNPAGAAIAIVSGRNGRVLRVLPRANADDRSLALIVRSPQGRAKAVAVGAPGEWRDDGEGVGGVTILPLGTSESPRCIRAPKGTIGFGRSLVGCADLDGDGVSDLLVGASMEEPQVHQEYRSSVVVISGQTGVELGRVEIPINGTWGVLPLASSPRRLDGRSRFYIGIPSLKAAHENAGVVMECDAIGPLALQRMTPESARERFGEALCMVPDLDGDGDADVAIASRDAGDEVRGARAIVEVRGTASGKVIWLRPVGEPGWGGVSSMAVLSGANGTQEGAIVLGIQYADPGGRESAGWVTAISLKSGMTMWEHGGQWEHGRLGASIAAIPVEGESGSGEVAVGAPGEDGTWGSVAGAVLRLSGQKASILWTSPR